MEKIKLRCQRNTSIKLESNLGVFFQGWLLSHLENEFVEELHQPILKPYTVSAKMGYGNVDFIVTLNNERAIQAISPMLLNDSLSAITLISSKQQVFHILEKQCETLTQKDLGEIFYRAKKKGDTYLLKFETPTSFKSKSEYIFQPDLRLIFQSLMKNYSYFFENTQSVNTDLLDELCKNTKIVSYDLKSHYYMIHQTRIPGFMGEIKIKCFGNETLKNYLAMLCSLAEYVGIGIKTSMGMGAVSYKK